MKTEPVPYVSPESACAGKSSKFSAHWVCAGLLLAGLWAAGCDSTGPPSTPVKSVHAVADFQALTRERDVLERGSIKEYRNAARFEAGREYEFGLGEAAAGNRIVVSLREDKPNAAPVTVRVSVDGTVVHELISDSTGTWQDWIFSIDPESLVLGRCVVRASSASPFWMSALDVSDIDTEQPNVIVILIDTLRMDHLSCYGYERETSPRLDEFARDAVRFTQMVPASSWTRPSVTSLLTSTYPNVHGAIDRGDKVREGMPWLGESLEAAGYEGIAIMTNPHCIPLWGIGCDFSRFVDMGTDKWLQLDDQPAVAEALKFVSSAAPRPYFLYLHLFAPHDPYEPPEVFRQKIAGMPLADDPVSEAFRADRDLYDAEIAYCDSLIGELLDRLRAVDEYDSSMIVVLSDHGEEFGEHGGTGHGKTLYEEQLRVPLLVKLPGNRNAGEVRDSIVEIVDVAPTILDEVALPADARFQGTSLLRAIREGDSRWEGRIGYASLFLDERSMRAAKSAHLKYVHDLVGESEQWFDLKSDPRERTPLPAAPAAGEVLRNHARRVGAFGASGFHLLLTHDSTRDIVVTGTITGAADARAEIRYPADRVRIERDDEVIRFEVRMPLVENREQASARWREVFELESETVVGLLRMGAPQTEQDHAEIIVDVPPDAALQVQLYVDGNPVDPASVRSGASGTPLALDGTAIRMPDTIAPADAYDPAALPQSTAVYVWYIPSAETLADDQLDPGIRESLEALGYIE